MSKGYLVYGYSVMSEYNLRARQSLTLTSTPASLIFILFACYAQTVEDEKIEKVRVLRKGRKEMVDHPSTSACNQFSSNTLLL